jgi:hypothetical protein
MDLPAISTMIGWMQWHIRLSCMGSAGQQVAPPSSSSLRQKPERL